MELKEQKKLKELVDDFMADLKERRNKINERINELAGQLADIQSKITRKHEAINGCRDGGR